MIKNNPSGTLLTWLLYSSLFIFPFGNIFRIDTGVGIALVPLDLVVGLICIASLPLHMDRLQAFKKDPLFGYASLFVGIGLVSLLINSIWLSPLQVVVSALYTFRLIAYLNLIWVVALLSARDRKWLIVGLGISAVTMLLLGVGQYFLYPDLRNLYYLGWDEHLNRLFGTTLDPNFTGALLISFIGILAYSKLLYTQYTKPIIWISVITACSVALTYSRSSMIMLIGAGCVYTFLHRKKAATLPLIAGVLLLAGVLTATQTGESVNLFRTASIQARFIEYSEAQKIIKDSPILGVGFNAYRYAQLRHGFIDLDTWIHDHAGAGVPNTYLFVLATTGGLGFLAYAAFWITFMKQLYARKDFILFSLMMGLFVHAFFENSLFYPHLMYIIFLLKGYSDTLPQSS